MDVIGIGAVMMLPMIALMVSLWYSHTKQQRISAMIRIFTRKKQKVRVNGYYCGGFMKWMTMIAILLTSTVAVAGELKHERTGTSTMKQKSLPNALVAAL